MSEFLIYGMAAVGVYFAIGFWTWLLRAIYFAEDSSQVILETIYIFAWPVAIYLTIKSWLK